MITTDAMNEVIRLHEWITDRPPTEKDGDDGGKVLMKSLPDWPNAEGAEVHWSHVGSGIPWRCTVYWDPQPALAVGQRWRRRDGVVVTIDEFDPDAGKFFYTLCARRPVPHFEPHPYDLVELLPPSPLEDLVKQLKEIRDRIQPILDLHYSLPPN